MDGWAPGNRKDDHNQIRSLSSRVQRLGVGHRTDSPMTRSRSLRMARAMSIGVVAVALLSLSTCSSASDQSGGARQTSTRTSCPAPGPTSSVTPRSGLPGLVEGKTYSLYSSMPSFPWEGSFESHNVEVKITAHRGSARCDSLLSNRHHQAMLAAGSGHRPRQRRRCPDAGPMGRP
jgi:hypothetical protein